MSLHSIVEPAGTLVMGWGLIGKHDKKPDIRNRADEIVPPGANRGSRPEPAPVHTGP